MSVGPLGCRSKGDFAAHPRRALGNIPRLGRVAFLVIEPISRPSPETFLQTSERGSYDKPCQMGTPSTWVPQVRSTQCPPTIHCAISAPLGQPQSLVPLRSCGQDDRGLEANRQGARMTPIASPSSCKPSLQPGWRSGRSNVQRERTFPNGLSRRQAAPSLRSGSGEQIPTRSPPKETCCATDRCLVAVAPHLPRTWSASGRCLPESQPKAQRFTPVTRRTASCERQISRPPKSCKKLRCALIPPIWLYLSRLPYKLFKRRR